MVNGKFKGKNSLRSKASSPDAFRFKGASKYKRKVGAASKEGGSSKVARRLAAFAKWKNRLTRGRSSKQRGALSNKKGFGSFLTPRSPSLRSKR